MSNTEQIRPFIPIEKNLSQGHLTFPRPISDRTPSTLSELKQQRLVAAADRKKRLVTRIITIVGLLMILLCAAIVALTLKMAPKIDELVRTKTGAHVYVHFSRASTTMIPNNVSTTSNKT